MKIKLPVAALVMMVLIYACSKKDSPNPTAASPGPQFSDTNITYLFSQKSANDTIDSTGTYYTHLDTTFWVRDSAGIKDTVSALITVTGDTARVGNAMIPPLTVPLTISGILVKGAGGTFEGSVWKVSSVSTPSVPLAAAPAPGTSMFLYFKPASHKVYVLDNNKALNKLGAELILKCPVAFYSPVIALMGYTINTAKSDCDTIWASNGLLSGYIVGNTDSLTLDIYTSGIKVYAIPLVQ